MGARAAGTVADILGLAAGRAHSTRVWMQLDTLT